ncbi:MAG: biopolymer transporter ExbD [Pseudomonadota bacterium]
MAFTPTPGESFAGEDAAEPVLSEINMVPFIDVMLVLLIIFMVTAPLLTHAVKVELPQAASSPNQPTPDSIQLAIDAQGQLFWDGEAVDTAQLDDRLKHAATQTPLPELQIRAERKTPYEQLAQVMSAAARQGLSRISLVTDPTAQSAR